VGLGGILVNVDVGSKAVMVKEGCGTDVFVAGAGFLFELRELPNACKKKKESPTITRITIDQRRRIKLERPLRIDINKGLFLVLCFE